MIKARGKNIKFITEEKEARLVELFWDFQPGILLVLLFGSYGIDKKWFVSLNIQKLWATKIVQLALNMVQGKGETGPLACFTFSPDFSAVTGDDAVNQV